MIVGEDGKTSTEKDIIERDDFWATTSNKQLKLVQHIKLLLKVHGRAAVVVRRESFFDFNFQSLSNAGQSVGPAAQFRGVVRVS